MACACPWRRCYAQKSADRTCARFQESKSRRTSGISKESFKNLQRQFEESSNNSLIPYSRVGVLRRLCREGEEEGRRGGSSGSLGSVLGILALLPPPKNYTQPMFFFSLLSKTPSQNTLFLQICTERTTQQKVFDLLNRKPLQHKRFSTFSTENRHNTPSFWIVDVKPVNKVFDILKRKTTATQKGFDMINRKPFQNTWFWQSGPKRNAKHQVFWIFCTERFSHSEKKSWCIALRLLNVSCLRLRTSGR